MKRHEPINYRNTRWVWQSFEYLCFRLTGVAAAISLGPDDIAKARADQVAAGLDPKKFPDRCIRTGDVYGMLAPRIATELGLPTGLPVVAGTVDSFASWVGTATFTQGTACNTIGTTNSFAVVWNQPLQDASRRVGPVRQPCGSNWVIAGATSSGGNWLEWFARSFYPDTRDGLSLVTKEAATVPAGADGLLALPYLEGERAPLQDSQARAVFFGISERHRRAHFAKAVLEAMAFAVRDVYEVLQSVGAIATEVRLAGPAARDTMCSQMRADVLGLPVLISEFSESGLLGAAMIAAVGTGVLS